MPVAAMTALATVTLASNDSSVDFVSIPSTYRDLILIGNYGQASTGFAGKAYFNADTTSGNYASVRILGNGSSDVSNANGGSIRWETQGASNSTLIIQILDYSTAKQKIALVRAGNAGTNTEASVTRWSDLNTVNALRLAFGTDITAGSTFSLFGVEGEV